MMRDQDFEDRLAAWLEEGPTSAPDAPVDAAIAHAWTHRRRGRGRWLAAVPGPAQDVVAPVQTWRVAPRGRLSLVLVVAAVILALLGAVLVGSRLLTVRPPGNGILAFSYGGDIWTVGLDGRPARDLTTEGFGNETAPAWSPDGRLLAFRVETLTEPRTFSVDVIDLASGARRTLAANGHATTGRLSFSPDGRWLAFGFGTGPLPAVTIAAVDGSSPARSIEGLAGTSPAFSPDGRRVAFVGRTTEAARTDVYVAELSTLAATRLTTYERLGLGWVGSPSWAEAGRTIVFDAAIVDSSGRLSHSVYRVGADGSGLRRIDGPLPAQEADQLEAGLVVSPDGRLVAYRGEGELQVRDVASGASAGPTLPDPRLGGGGLAWAPDGTALAVLTRAECPSVVACPGSVVIIRGQGTTASAAWTALSLPGAVTAPDFTWDLAWQPLPTSGSSR